MFKQFFVRACLLCLMCQPVQAFYVEITGGQATGLPIAVLPFQVKPKLTDAPFDMAALIRRDLQNSGQFQSLPLHKMPQKIAQASDLQTELWPNIDNVLLGRIEAEGGLYKVSIELLDLIKGRGAKHVSLRLNFDKVSPDALRGLSHQIADRIYQQLIGVRGIFSSRIAYVHVDRNMERDYYTLEIADQDGYNPQALKRSVHPIMSPAWSPDGQRIAFVSFEGHRASVRLIELQSGLSRVLTQFPGINGAPAWSPDGKSLALVLSKDGGPKIYILDIASRALRQITFGPAIDTEPRFAPDGQTLVFTSNRSGRAQIYRVNLKSAQVERLSFHGSYNARPSITPDGQSLVMMHRELDHGPFSIAVQALKKDAHPVLLTHASLDESPSIAPNGMMVIYGAQSGVLGAVSLDGRVKLRLPARTGYVQEPAWSPFLP